MAGGVQPEAGEHRLEETGPPSGCLPGRGGRGHDRAHDPDRDREFPFIDGFDRPPGTGGNAGESLAQARQCGPRAQGPKARTSSRSCAAQAASSPYVGFLSRTRWTL